MPYQWSHSDESTRHKLDLWPYQSLSPQGLESFVLITFALIIIPLFGVLGTKLFWALLPFILLSVGGIWYALSKSQRDRSTLETLSVSAEETVLERINVKAKNQRWHCNTYWVRVSQYALDGPVPDYITLAGNGREVEIGSFLNHEERKQLYIELDDLFAKIRSDV